MEEEEGSDQKLDLLSIYKAVHACLKNDYTYVISTKISLAGSYFLLKIM